MSRIAHLLGNGPSRKSFVQDPIGDAYGCNLSDDSLNLTATFIMDAEVFEHLQRSGHRPPWPIICPERWVRPCSKMYPPIKVLDTLPRISYNGENTGHHAAIWLADHGYDKIHLWGFDSLREDTVESDSHQKIPGAIWTKNNIPKWRTHWAEIFKRWPEKFLIR